MDLDWQPLIDQANNFQNLMQKAQAAGPIQQDAAGMFTHSFPQSLTGGISAGQLALILGSINRTNGHVLMMNTAGSLDAATQPQAEPIAPPADPLASIATGLTTMSRNMACYSNRRAAPAVARTSLRSVATAAAAAPATPGVSIINDILNGLPKVTTTPQDIEDLINGSSGTINWWGWTLTMNETATKGFESLLGSDVPGLLAIVTAIGATCPSLLAAGAIATAVSEGFNAWMKAEDRGTGVVIRGYMWIAPWVGTNTAPPVAAKPAAPAVAGAPGPGH